MTIRVTVHEPDAASWTFATKKDLFDWRERDTIGETRPMLVELLCRGYVLAACQTNKNELWLWDETKQILPRPVVPGLGDIDYLHADSSGMAK